MGICREHCQTSPFKVARTMLRRCPLYLFVSGPSRCGTFAAGFRPHFVDALRAGRRFRFLLHLCLSGRCTPLLSQACLVFGDFP
jgi:hypothetical protein